MLRRFVLIVAGTLPSLVLAATFAQEPPQKAGVEGVVVEAGTGAPLADARITLTLSPQRGGPGGARGIPPELLADPEMQAMIARGEISPELASTMGGGRGRGFARPVPIPPAATDGQGRFSFGNLEPGSYMMAVQADGYLPQQYGQRYAAGAGTPINLTAGQLQTDVSVRLTPAGNISGSLRDAADQPIPNVSVQLLRPVYNANGGRTLQVAGGARTDDRGMFRIYWVTPGSYYLQAVDGGEAGSETAMMLAMSGALGGGGNPNELPPSISSAFYPGVADAANALLVEIGPSGDVSGIAWTVPPELPRRRVRGRVIDARTGKPPAQAMVTISPVSTGLAIPNAGMLSDLGYGYGPGGSRQYNPATGVMEFKDLKPGVYEITGIAQDMSERNMLLRYQSQLGGGGPEMSPPGAASGAITVTVSDVDLEDVLLTVAPTGSLTGQMRFEGEPPAPSPQRGGFGGGVGGGFGGPGGGIGRGANRPQTLPISIQLVSTRPNFGGYGYYGGGGASGAPGLDGTFRLNNVAPGEYRLQVGMPAANFYVKSALVNGANILESPLVVVGMAAGNMEIVVSSNGGKVQGSLLDERGDPVARAQAVLVPNRSRGRPDLFKMVVTDAEGKFTFNGVPPGEYKVFSWESIDPYGWFDPEVLERSESRAAPVHVSESSVENVVARIIPAGGSR